MCRSCFLAVILGCSLGMGEIQAQAFDNTTHIFDQFFKNYTMVNPANQDTSSKIRIQLGNRSLTNLFDGVSRLYGDLNFTIKHPSPSRYSNIGLLVTNNQDGAFISKSSLYGRYGWQTALNAYASLSFGASLGAVNYSIKSSQADPGGADWALDGNVGLWFLHRKFKLGVSYLQIFGQTLRPVREQFVLQPYWNLNLQYLFFKTPFVSLSTHIYVNNSQGPTWQLEAAPIFEIMRYVETGVNYRYNNGIAMIIGLKALPIFGGKANIMASYLFSTGTTSISTNNVIEFSLGFTY